MEQRKRKIPRATKSKKAITDRILSFATPQPDLLAKRIPELELGVLDQDFVPRHTTHDGVCFARKRATSIPKPPKNEATEHPIGKADNLPREESHHQANNSISYEESKIREFLKKRISANPQDEEVVVKLMLEYNQKFSGTDHHRVPDDQEQHIPKPNPTKSEGPKLEERKPKHLQLEDSWTLGAIFVGDKSENDESENDESENDESENNESENDESV